jgi:hypothetical protein
MIFSSQKLRILATLRSISFAAGYYPDHIFVLLVAMNYNKKSKVNTEPEQNKATLVTCG